ncbi:MAG: DNA polymerase III subunit beta [Phycisphaerales bacterium]|nr:DNA polymerase III subunit beta [Phycisphaerales bacterium]
MKLRLDRAELAEALAVAGSVAASRTPKVALQCVRFDVHKDFAMVSATDLELGVRVSLTQIQVETKGSLLVPAEKVSQIVRECTDEVLAIETKDGECHIRGEDSHFKIYEHELKDFPPIPEMEGAVDFEVKVDDLRRLSDWTVFSAARENTRYAINGVLWDKSEERLTLVATDGRRLSKASLPMPAGGSVKRTSIVPIKAMQVMSRILGDGEGTVGVQIKENQILLKTTRVSLTSALLEGHFPNYEEVIPTDSDKKVVMDTRELLGAVRRAALLSTEESRGVRLAFESGKLTITSRAPEQGEAVVVISIDYDGPSAEIGFNPTFLVDVLRAVPEDKITFEFRESRRPGVFRSGERFLYVVMPVNLT